MPTPATTEQPAPAPPVPKITLLLVLGHHFERLVRKGAVRDYAEIARRTGLTRARITQITGLVLLAPEIQAVILGLTATPEGDDPIHERGLRSVLAEPDWGIQRLLSFGLR